MSVLSKIGAFFGVKETHYDAQAVKAQIIEAIKPDFDKWAQQEALVLTGPQALSIAQEIVVDLKVPVSAADTQAILTAFVAKLEPIVQGKLDALLDAEAGLTPAVPVTTVPML